MASAALTPIGGIILGMALGFFLLGTRILQVLGMADLVFPLGSMIVTFSFRTATQPVAFIKGSEGDGGRMGFSELHSLHFFGEDLMLGVKHIHNSL